MTFVPTPVVPTEDLSPRARDLARNLETSLQEFRQRNPSLTDAEVRQALAHLSRGHTAAPRVALLLAVGVGLAILGLVFFMFAQGGSAAGTDRPVVWIAMGIGALAAIAGLAAAAGRMGR